jgi:hypothetical protein
MTGYPCPRPAEKWLVFDNVEKAMAMQEMVS